MPELPEVKTTVDFLKANILGYKIKNVWTDNKKYLKKADNNLNGNVILYNEYKKILYSTEINDIKRVGKNIFIILSKRKKDIIWHVHLKMTGHFLIADKKKYIISENQFYRKKKRNVKDPLEDNYNRFIHFYLMLEQKNKKSIYLAFSDMRKFGKMVLYPFVKSSPEDKIKEILKKEKIGFDALKDNYNEKKFLYILKNKKIAIKKLLLDQSILAGIGNIYADEILFASKINPNKKCNGLNLLEWKRIAKNIRIILKKAIEKKGTSERDFRIPNGKKGSYQNFLKIYGKKEGEICKICKKGKVKKIKIGGRTTTYCDWCQK